MNIDTAALESRLRTAARLLLSLPATVAAACFAHGHGALGSYSLLAVLVLAIVAGAGGAYLLLSLVRPRDVQFDTNPDSQSDLPAAAASFAKH